MQWRETLGGGGRIGGGGRGGVRSGKKSGEIAGSKEEEEEEERGKMPWIRVRVWIGLGKDDSDNGFDLGVIRSLVGGGGWW